MTKRGLTIIIAGVIALFSASSLHAQNESTYFPYPQVTDDMGTLQERCNFLVYNFWERCNIKQSFSSMDRLNKAFGDWLSFMPYASADTVMSAIDNYLQAVAKTGPDNLVSIGKMAEQWVYTDSSEYYSEELYLPFCKAVAQGKKVSKAKKARFEAQLEILENSSVGSKVPDFDFIMPDGTTGNMKDVIASRVILFFNDPDCTDCTLAKARLSADYNLNRLIDKGLVKLVAIYPGEATDEWKEQASRMPDNWIVGASNDVDRYFDLAVMPALYYLDARHKIMNKNIVLDNLLIAMQQVAGSMQLD